MPNFRNSRRLFLVIILVAGSFPCLYGQTSPQAQTSASADDALLAKAANLYYSTAKSGLSGFDCAVHPDWREVFVSSRQGASITSADQANIALLNGVAIRLHARLNNKSSLDWTVAPGAVSDADSTSLLTQMHSATEQTLLGFMQFWSPFMDGSVLPSNAGGITVTHTSSTFNLHAEQPGTTVDEAFSSDLLLLEYDVTTGGTSVKFAPAYKATPQGLLVEHFLAHLQKVSDPPGAAQEIHVGIEYQTVEGFPIPARLNMELVGTAVFNFALDGCRVNPQAN